MFSNAPREEAGEGGRLDGMRRRGLEERGRACCDGPGLCLPGLDTDLPRWSSPSVFLFIDSPDMQPHNSAEQTEKERLAG